jgi:tRNA pseudouridine32 synthase / 23S rRNA pseudouridine746 synthase
MTPPTPTVPAPTANEDIAHADGASVSLVDADEACLVADKPPGLPTVPGRAPGLDDCLWSRLCATWPDARVVHRLDMATSGLVVFARSLAVQRLLSRAFESRQVEKVYVAWVQGRLGAPGVTFTIDLPLRADWPNRPRQVVDRRDGKPAFTDVTIDRINDGQGRCPLFELASTAHETTRLILRPRTGRTHQLRVHLAAIGHPIVGDPLYGPRAEEPGQARSSRLLLHAQSLALHHPTRGDWCRWTVNAPF